MNQCNCLEYREVIDTLTAKVKRYEEALEFYADGWHYRLKDDGDVELETGENALDALSEFSEKWKNEKLARATLNQGEGEK